MAPASNLAAAALCLGLGTAALIDARHRRIPNLVSMGTAGVGLLMAAFGLSGISVAAALAGFAAGLVMMLPGHVFGATGAGDVKLFAAAGTLLGGGRMVWAFLFVAIAGGALALLIAWQRGRLARTITMTARLCGRDGHTKAAIDSAAEHNRFPYGPAIAVGCVLAAWR